MVLLNCAIVEEGSVISVVIEEWKTVALLKKAIKDEKPLTITGEASELQLFLAKTTGAQWLKSGTDDVNALKEGKKTANIEALLGKGQELQPESGLQKVLHGMEQPSTDHIHVLVVLPKAGESGDHDGKNYQEFNAPIEFSTLEHTGGVPSTFRTFRTATVAAIASLLDRKPVIFVRAPPLSGKTAVCDLLYNHIVRSKPDALISRIRANLMPNPVNFSEYFKSIHSCDLQTFSKFKLDRVVLIDEAQVTYDDELLWLGYLKATLDGGFPGMRFVLFSSYGSFDVYRKHERAGTPILIPPENTIGLTGTSSKPGLQLSREELEEMVQNSIGASISDLIWILCSGHIGIARAILMFLVCKFGPRTPSPEDLEMELRSLGLLHYIRFSYRGIPTADAFQRVVQAQDPSKKLTLKMGEILNGVAAGKVVPVTDGQRAPTSQTAVELLTKYGFLYEDQAKQLQFASSMHLKIWLYSNRTDPVGFMVSDFSHEDFVVACVQRMSASRLQNFATQNTSSIARERQIQMELYGATTSCLPQDVLVTPEWRTEDGKGFIDLVIRGSSILWFWELLVNGDDAVGHSKRFETGGKYYGSLTGSSKYVLIDFRQNRGVRHQKHGFLYVSFVDSYTKALIFSLGKPVVSAELSS